MNNPIKVSFFFYGSDFREDIITFFNDDDFGDDIGEDLIPYVKPLRKEYNSLWSAKNLCALVFFRHAVIDLKDQLNSFHIPRYYKPSSYSVKFISMNFYCSKVDKLDANIVFYRM